MPTGNEEASYLTQVPEPYHQAYIEEDDDTNFFRLSSPVARVVYESETELARLQTEIDRVHTVGNATLTSLRQESQDAAVARALRTSLTHAGVKVGLQEAAVALLKSEHKFDVEAADNGDGSVVLVDTPFGLHSVDAIVSQWIESDEAKAFRDKTTAPNDGYFGSLLTGLKQRR